MFFAATVSCSKYRQVFVVVFTFDSVEMQSTVTSLFCFVLQRNSFILFSVRAGLRVESVSSTSEYVNLRPVLLWRRRRFLELSRTSRRELFPPS